MCLRFLIWRSGGIGCMNSSTHAFSAPDFYSGGRWSSLGRAPRGGLGGPFPCTFSVPRYPATCFLHFLCSVIESSIRLIFPRHAYLIFQHSKTRSARLP